MNFAKLRHKIVFLKPLSGDKNSMNEQTIRWQPYNPVTGAANDLLYVTTDNEIVYKNGILYSFSENMRQFSICANVVPTSGREYTESQKLRPELTYRITTRYFKNISQDMKILYGTKVFDIVSIINLDGRKNEMQIICTESDYYGANI